MSKSHLIPNLQNDLQQIHFDISRRPGDLASKITEGFMQTYHVERGLPVSTEHREAIEQIAIAIQMMAEGNPKLPPYFLLSTLPTGAGKTTLMVEAVKAIVADRTYAQVGIVIFVNYLKQIPILVAEMGLRADQYAVRTGKANEDCNELGRTGLMQTEQSKRSAHHHAQVLFTTHAKVRAVAVRQRNFADSRFFQFEGITRQVRIWDEAILPADPIVLTTKEVEEYVRRLKGWDEIKAAAMLDKWLAALSHMRSDTVSEMPRFITQMPLPPSDVDDDFEPPSERSKELYVSALAEKMWLLAGHKVRVHCDVHSGTTAITYRDSLPLEFAPLLILDAGGELAMTYHAWGEGRGNLRQLPSARKSYRNLTTHYWDHRAGKTAHRDNDLINELASGVASAVDQIRKADKNEKILIIHRLHQKRYADLTKRIRKHVNDLGGSIKGLRFLHYGCHTATNEFKDFKHVVLVGLLQYSDPEYHALWRAAKGVPVQVPALKEEVAKLRLGVIETHLLQAAGRSAIRKMVDGDVPEGCHLWVVFSSWATGKGGVSPAILCEAFPGTKLCRWQPLPEKLRAGAERVVIAAERALGEQGEVAVCLRDLAIQARLTWAPTQDHLRKPMVLRELCRRGITVEGPRPISPKGVVTLRRGCQQRACEPVLEDANSAL